MFRRIDTIAIVLAFGLHAGIAIAMIHMPARPPRTPTTIEVEMRTPKPPPPPITQPEAPKPPPPPKVVQKVKQAPPPTPTPAAEPPKEPPKEVKPVFGMTETMTNDDSNVAMPQGNTTMIDPKNSGHGKPTPLPAAPPAPAPKPAYKPVADLYVAKLPDIDGEACARMVSYPSEAEQLGVEGEVKLRVALDESGHVHDIKVLHGLGHGLDQAAVNALRYKCHFKPAIGTDGKPVAYVIQSYVWNFELPR